MRSRHSTGRLVPWHVRILHALAQILVSLPSIVLSGWLLWALADMVGTSLVVAVGVGWAASGIGYFLCLDYWTHQSAYHAVDDDSPQRAKLDAAWAEVARAAGIDAARYRPWIDHSDRDIAYTGPSRHIAVSRDAIDTLPPAQLRAVLAHELGHHLVGQALIWALVRWFRRPVETLYLLYALALALAARGTDRAMMRLGQVLLGFERMPPIVLFAASMLVPVTVGIGVTVGFLVAFAHLIGLPAALILLALSAPQPLARAKLAQWTEYRADRVAVDLGYGPALSKFLHHRESQHPLDEMAFAPGFGAMRRAIASHPQLWERRIEVDHHVRRREHEQPDGTP